jgi:hypothetical protein
MSGFSRAVTSPLHGMAPIRPHPVEQNDLILAERRERTSDGSPGLGLSAKSAGPMSKGREDGVAAGFDITDMQRFARITGRFRYEVAQCAERDAVEKPGGHRHRERAGYQFGGGLENLPSAVIAMNRGDFSQAIGEEPDLQQLAPGRESIPLRRLGPAEAADRENDLLLIQ